MATMLVVPPALNLRSEPFQRPPNVIDKLPVGHEVNVVGDAREGTWNEVETTLDDRSLTGFVSARFLRLPGSSPSDALLRESGKESRRFQFGEGREEIDPFAGFVGEMWTALGLGFDGRDDIPWSAAFISFVVRNAAYQGFAFSSSHSRYIHDAIVKRLSNDASSPFWGFRLNEHRPEIGDLTCQWRENEKTFDEAAEQEFFKSHCNVVVEVRPNTVRTIGGNLSNSVSLRSFHLDQNGFLEPERRLFAIMRNNH